jgi:hypothetical protein
MLLVTRRQLGRLRGRKFRQRYGVPVENWQRNRTGTGFSFVVGFEVGNGDVVRGG